MICHVLISAKICPVLYLLDLFPFLRSFPYLFSGVVLKQRAARVFNSDKRFNLGGGGGGGGLRQRIPGHLYALLCFAKKGVQLASSQVSAHSYRLSSLAGVTAAECLRLF